MAHVVHLLLFSQAFLQRIRQNVADSVEKGLTEENVKVRTGPLPPPPLLLLLLLALLLLGDPTHWHPSPGLFPAALEQTPPLGVERVHPRSCSPVQPQHASCPVGASGKPLLKFLGAWYLLLLQWAGAIKTGPGVIGPASFWLWRWGVWAVSMGCLCASEACAGQHSDLNF